MIDRAAATEGREAGSARSPSPRSRSAAVMGRIRNFWGAEFMDGAPQRVWAHRRSPHRTGANSGRRAAPGRQTLRARIWGTASCSASAALGVATRTSSAPGIADERSAAAASSQTAIRGGCGLRAASSGAPASCSRTVCGFETAGRLRCDAHRGRQTGHRICRLSTSSRETATTGIAAGSARPLTALSPTRTPVKLPGPLTATIAPSCFNSMPALASSSATAAMRV